MHAVTLHASGSYPDVVSHAVPRERAGPIGAPIAVGDTFDVEVGSVAHGGHCVGRVGELVVFIRHAIPGERVRIRVTDVRKRFLRADVIDVLQPSSDRRAPLCEVADSCGGCDFQHVTEVRQRRMKLDVMREALTRHGRLPDERVDALLADGIIDLGLHTGWRSRMRYRVKVDASDAGAVGTLGMSKHRSDEWVDASSCVIADPFGHDLARQRARAEENESELLMATGSAGPKVQSRMDTRTQDTGQATVRHCIEVDGRILEFVVPIDGFWQVHPNLPQSLVDRVLVSGDPQPGQTWWDLYAGVGPLAGALACRVGPDGCVEAVESSASAVDRGTKALSELSWVRWHRSDVLNWLRKEAKAPRNRPYGVVLDPPRSGAGAQVVAAICSRRPEVIVMVACDPVALGRDTALLSGHGYQIADLRVWDAFPQTHHMEAIASYRPTHQIS